MKTLAHACALLCALSFGGSLIAQVAADTTSSKPAADQAMAEAQQLRSDSAAKVISGETSPEIAIGRLKASNSPSGLKIDGDADFAFAAIDVGRRLIGARKPVEAEAFFRSAEASLDTVIGRTADTAARDKVQYLSQRAVIRANYLNKLTEARADLDAALKLAPEDKRLRQMSRLIPADPAATLQNHKEQPSRG